MKQRLFLMGISVCLIPTLLQAQESKERKWDQKKAVSIIKNLIEQENNGDFAWDNIDWMKDPEKAVARAKKEQKPIFVFLFLKKKVGPAAAPC